MGLQLMAGCIRLEGSKHDKVNPKWITRTRSSLNTSAVKTFRLQIVPKCMGSGGLLTRALNLW